MNRIYIFFSSLRDDEFFFELLDSVINKKKNNYESFTRFNKIENQFKAFNYEKNILIQT